MNIKLLRKVKAAILKEPRQFVMSRWFKKGQKIPNCKTALTTSSKLALIEGAFEPESCRAFSKEEHMPSAADRARCDKFSKRHWKKGSDRHAIAIFTNIIRNKGTFKP